MSNISYNPYRAAFSAMTSPEAQQYYVRRSVEDITATVGGISALGVVAYWLGGQALHWPDSILMAATIEENSVFINEKNGGATGLLTPCKEVQPQPQQAINEAWVLNAIAPPAKESQVQSHPVPQLSREDEEPFALNPFIFASFNFQQPLLPPAPVVEPKPQTVTQFRKSAKTRD